MKPQAMHKSGGPVRALWAKRPTETIIVGGRPAQAASQAHERQTGTANNGPNALGIRISSAGVKSRPRAMKPQAMHKSGGPVRAIWAKRRMPTRAYHAKERGFPFRLQIATQGGQNWG
jgi:hypothetical protein